MFQRWGGSLLTIVALVSVLIVSHAQALPPLTRHVREVTLHGQAPLVGRLPATETMRLVLVLPLRNEAELDNFLQGLYDPTDMSYRQFLTVEEFTFRFGPTQEDYDAVVHFAEANGLAVVGTSRNRMNVEVTGSVSSIEEAFHLTMGVYQHPTENRIFFAPDREPNPYLSVQLWRIAGLDNYSIPHPNFVQRDQRDLSIKSNATTGSGPSASFLGSDMRAAYYGETTLTGRGQSLGLLEYFGTDLADLHTYFENIGQKNNVPITLLSTDGTSTSCLASQGCHDTEQTLDMTQALGMAPGLSSLVMYVGSSDAAIFNAMATASPLNAQLSSSWTWIPADPSTDNPYFKEFAAQGQNLFQASGDGGAWTSSSAIYPADDVYVTSVGGTDLDTSSAGGPWKSETAWIHGGGGISPDKYEIPSWQRATASGCSACSKSERNGPDVSANANFTFYVCANQTTCSANLYGGTSFAAPMWAGYMALINQQAVANGNQPLGFINPTLYTIGLSSDYDTDFHDTTGGNDGYPATTGYDLATGLGSPHGVGLIHALGRNSSSSSFSLSVSRDSVSAVQGGSTTSIITSMVTGNFDSAISLSASGQPAGVTVSFNPTSITGAGTSTMTAIVGPSTITGTYDIAVKGTSGGVSEKTTVSLTVTSPKRNFTISASPKTFSVAKGGKGTATIMTRISGGFDSAISLSATGEGPVQVLAFSPKSIAAPGSGTSTMTVRVGKDALVGDHTITITGKGAGVTHTTTVTLNVLD
jgi:subtilase family serine protease